MENSISLCRSYFLHPIRQKTKVRFQHYNIYLLMSFIRLIFPVIIMVLMLVGKVKGYSTSNQLQYFVADSGRKTLTSIVNNPSTYSFSFSKQFNSTPQVLVTLARIQYATSNKSEWFDIRKSRVITKTDCVITMQWITPNLITTLGVNYYVIDPSSWNFIRNYESTVRIEDHNWPGNSVNRNSDQFSVTYNASAPGTAVICFLQKIIGVKQSGATYEMDLSCSVQSNGKIKVEVFCDQSFSGVSGFWAGIFWINTKQFFVNTVVVRGLDPAILMFSSTLVAQSSAPSGVIPVDPTLPSEFLMIGLREFQLPNRNLNFGLADSSKLIAYGDYLQISYDYFILFRKGEEFVFLNRLFTDLYDKDVRLHYGNYTNVSLCSKYDYTVDDDDVIGIDDGDLSSDGMEYMVKCGMKKPVTNSDITAIYNYSKITQTYIKKSVFRIVIINSIEVFFIQKSIKLAVTNARNASESNFQFNAALFNLLNTTQKGDNSEMFLEYKDSTPATDETLKYNDAFGFDDKVEILFCVPQFSWMETSILSYAVTAVFSNLKNVLAGSQFSWTKTKDFVRNVQFLYTNDTAINMTYQYKDPKNVRGGAVSLVYEWDSQIGNKVSVHGVKIMTLVHLLHTLNQSIYELRWINLDDPDNVSHTQFNSTETGITFKSAKANESDVILTIEVAASVIDTATFGILFAPDNTYQVLVKDIKIYTRYKNFTSVQYSNILLIYFNNPTNIDNNTLPAIDSTHPYITIKEICVTPDNEILIKAVFNNTVDGDVLQLGYSSDPNLLFSETINLKLEYDFPLIFCTGKLEVLSKLYFWLSNGLQYSYLGMFAVSVVFMNKLAGVEMMFLIQFAFYSMINIQLNCPYLGLGKMKYVSGYNPLFSSLNQQSIPFRMKDLGIQSNFLSNVNVMMFIIVICPVVFAILMYMGKKSDCYKKKPRYIKYGKAFLFETPLTILLFNSYNIYTSLAIQIKYYSSENIVSLAVGVIMGLMLPVYGFIYYFLKSHFSEFREEFETTERIASFTKETSIRIRQTYPLVLILQFLIFPFLMAIEELFEWSFYIALAVSLFGSAFVILATPYSHKIENLRLLIHRIIMASLIICQIVFKVLAKGDITQGGFIFYIPMVLLLLLALGLVVNGANILRMSYLWVRKRGVIDHKMKMMKQATKIKPVSLLPDPAGVEGNSIWYPKLEFGEFKKEQILNLRRKPKQNFVVQENLLADYSDQGI